MMNSKDQDHRAKQEGDPNDSKLTKASSTSRHWATFRNPRIVRVSRSFGGKDRHSKVCTVRGLRDRRIRLSVPTAIQLYDLQDRLGLSQPSKVVDWLLDATKSEIDKLPPLQMPPGNFSQFFQPLGVSQQTPSSSSASLSSLPHFFTTNSSSSYLKEGIKINDHHGHGNDQAMMDRLSKYWNPHGDRKMQGENKDKWIPSNEQQNHDQGFEGYNVSQLTAQNFFPIVNQSSFPNLFTNALPYNSFYQLEASNLSLSQFGTNNPISSNQPQDQISSSHMSSLPSGSHQLYFPTIINPPLPSYTTMESSSTHDPAKQVNHFQILSSTSQQLLQNPLLPTLHFISSPVKSNSLNVNPKILHSQETDENEGRSGS